MKRLIQILQLDHKWVRVMLSVSLVVVLFIILFPTQMRTKEASEPIIAYSVDSMAAPAPVNDGTSYFRFDSAGIDTTQRTMNDIHRPIMRRAPAGVPEYRRNDTIKGDTPIQIQIVQESKPFDWKGTITWAIGAMNGLVLIILNIKNLIFKKST